MKKRKSIFFVMLALVLCSQINSGSDFKGKSKRLAKLNAVNVAESGDYSKQRALGKGINVVTGSYLGASGVKYSNDIFSSSFIENNVGTQKIIPNSNQFDNYVSSFSVNNFLFDLSHKYNYSSGLGISDISQLYGGDLTIGISSYIDIAYKTYLSNYIFNQRYVYEVYRSALINANNNDLYRNNLDSSYVADLTKTLASDNLTAYNDFFDKYGTHIISEAAYGGAYDSYFIASSNITNIAVDFGGKLDSNLNAFFMAKEGNVNANSIGGASLSKTIQIDDASYIYRYNEAVYGGDAKKFNCTQTISVREKYINEWKDTIESNAKLLFATDYICLWDILPSTLNTSSNIEKLKKGLKMYSSYQKELTDKEYLKSYHYDNNKISLISTQTKVKGSWQTSKPNINNGLVYGFDFATKKYYKRNSSLGMENPTNFPNLYDYSLILSNGCKTVALIIEFDYKFIDDGTIDVFICNHNLKSITSYTNNVPDKGKSIGVLSYNSIGNSKTKKAGSISFVYNYDINSIDEEQLFVMFGSHGNVSNSFYLYNLKISIQFWR